MVTGAHAANLDLLFSRRSLGKGSVAQARGNRRHLIEISEALASISTGGRRDKIRCD